MHVASGRVRRAPDTTGMSRVAGGGRASRFKGRSGRPSPCAKLAVTKDDDPDKSPALSQVIDTPGPIDGRKIGIIAGADLRPGRH
jgi:hypothetical protein